MSVVRVAVPDGELGARLVDLRAEVSIWCFGDPPPSIPFDLLVLPYMVPASRLRDLPPGVARVLQSQTLGYDGVVDTLGPGYLYCNAVEVHEASTAELAVGLMIAERRGIPTFVDAQRTGRWAHGPQPGLAGSRVLLLGTGGVGEQLRLRLAPFEVELTRVGRRARDDEHGTIHGADELARLLPGADIVALAVPLDETTRGMVSHDFLARMKDGALLLNVARGPVVDTAALVEAVARGRIHAALDVTDPEPLPPDHPLWSAPTVTITPHVGGYTGAMAPRIRRVIQRQVELLAAGLEPTHVVLRT